MEIYSTLHSFASHGHQQIIVVLRLGEEYRQFSQIISNMPDFDAAMDLEGEEKDVAMFDLIKWKISEQIEEWIVEVGSKL